ncbi:SGM1 Protein SGM1 [Candida maltosa Xu316]
MSEEEPVKEPNDTDVPIDQQEPSTKVDSTEDQAPDQGVAQQPQESENEPEEGQQESGSKPKKRLTLQERLALAAKGKKKNQQHQRQSSDNNSSSATTTPPSLSRNVSSDDVKSTFLLSQELERLKVENASLAEKLKTKGSFEKEKSELLAKLESKEETIQQLLKEGEALSLKELKSNETIKKLKLVNQDLEESLRDYSLKNEESSMKLEDVEQFTDKYKELANELATAKSELQDYKDWEKRYNELLVSYEEETNARKSSLKELNEANIQLNILKREHKLELDSKNTLIADLKGEITSIKQNNSQEISRLEEKIESLRLETESNDNTLSENNTFSEDNKVDFDEFNKLSENHHNLQKQYLSSQENWKAIESNLLLKIDNLSTTTETLKKSKHKMTQEIAKLNNSLQSQSNDSKKLHEQIDLLTQEKSQLELTIEMKENDYTELNEKFEKFKEITNQERTNLNTKIQTLSEKLAKEEKKPDRINLNREYSVGSALSWDNSDIRLGESSTTPALNRDFSSFLDRNMSQGSFTEIGVDDVDDDLYGHHYSFNNSQGNLPGNRSNSIVGGVPPTSLQNNNIQLVNKMSSTIRRLEIELNTLKDEYSKMSEEKDTVEQEYLETLKLNDEVKSLQSQIDGLNQTIKEKETKEQTMLELIGEKSEQVEELRADVVDLKELMKLQVQQMVDMQQQQLQK